MRGAVFDLDGTLVDSAPDLIAAANELLEPHGLQPICTTEAHMAIGRGARALIAYSYRKSGWSDSEAAEKGNEHYQDFLTVYQKRIVDETRLYPGAEQVITAMAPSWRLGVCTNKPEKLAIELLDRLGVAEYFAAILGGDSVAKNKPDAMHLLETINRMDADPTRSLMIGDSETDHATALAANVPCILASFGYSGTPVETLNADAIFSHFDEVIPLANRFVS